MSPADPHFQAPAPATHLSAAQLRQYAAGTLGAAERRQVERHTLACALCADALDGYQQAAPAAVTPAALHELQQRLHARVAEPAAATRGGAWWLAAAAAVALLLVFVGIWQWPRSSTNDAPVAVRPRQAPSAAAPEVAAVTTPAPEPAASAPAAASPAVQQAAAPAPAAAASAAAPRRSRPARPAAVAVRPAVPQTETPLRSSELAVSNAPAAVADSARPAVAATELPEAKAAPAMAAKAPSKPMAMSRLATAPADSVPAFREEAGKRKAELPPAPALAPFPVGGYPALRTYLRREQRRPESGIGGPPRSDGTVKLKFMVEADGTVHNIQVVRGISPEYDEEAMRLICEGPAWRPAIVNGRRAAQAVRLDVPFH